MTIRINKPQLTQDEIAGIRGAAALSGSNVAATIADLPPDELSANELTAVQALEPSAFSDFAVPMVRSGAYVPRILVPTTFYQASAMWAAKDVSVAADRYTLKSPSEIVVPITDDVFYHPAQTFPDLSVAATWDTVAGTDYTVAANRAGVQFYIYACQPVSGTAPDFKVSVSPTAPTGYAAGTYRLVGSFHCLCAAVAHATALTGWTADTVMALGQTIRASTWDGYLYRCTVSAGDFKTHAVTEPDWASIAVGATIVDDQITWIKEQHTLEGYLQGDILPASVADAEYNWPSAMSPSGMTFVSPLDRWVDIYLQSGTGGSTVSAYGATVQASRSYWQHLADMIAVGKLIPQYAEHVVYSQNSPWSAQAAGTTAGGYTDSFGRRRVSNYGVEDCSGLYHQWTSSIQVNAAPPQLARVGGSVGESAATMGAQGFYRSLPTPQDQAGGNESARGICGRTALRFQ